MHAPHFVYLGSAPPGLGLCTGYQRPPYPLPHRFSQGEEYGVFFSWVLLELELELELLHGIAWLTFPQSCSIFYFRVCFIIKDHGYSVAADVDKIPASVLKKVRVIVMS